MPESNNRNQQPLTIRELIRKPLVKLAFIITLVATIADSFLGIRQIIGDYFPSWSLMPPALHIQFDRTDPIEAGTVVTLHYELPDHGYFSLWNKNGAGVITRFHPPENSKSESIALNVSNNIGKRYLEAQTPRTEEEVIAIWTKEEMRDPPLAKYSSWAQFKSFLDSRNSYNIKKTEISIQVL